MRSTASPGSLVSILVCWTATFSMEDDPSKRVDRPVLQQKAQRLIEQAYREAGFGRYHESAGHYTEALSLFRQLFPKDEFPSGHPVVASCLFDLANQELSQGKFEPAERNYRSALEMWRTLHPEKEEPNGHPEIASTLNNLGVTVMRQGKLDDAAECHRQALAMRRKLYPKDRFPLGHIQIAKSLVELGGIFELQGKNSSAIASRQRALDIASRLQTGKGPPKGERDARKITLGDEDFFLASSGEVPAAAASIDEYLPLGQDIDTYARMVSVTVYRQDMDLREFAGHLGANPVGNDRELKPRVVVKPDGSEALVDYFILVRDPEFLLEYNVFRIMKSKNYSKTYQYVRRIYQPTATQEREFREEVEKGRVKWLKDLQAADFPLPKG